MTELSGNYYIDTPMGRLKISPASDNEHPGVWISKELKGNEPANVALALIEFCSADYNSYCSNGTGNNEDSIVVRYFIPNEYDEDMRVAHVYTQKDEDEMIKRFNESKDKEALTNV